MLAPSLVSECQSFRTLSDDQLAAQFGDLLIEDQERLVLKLESILEMDRRKLFFECSSIWSCLVEKYCMEDYQAERLIRAARMMRRFPWIRDQLASGKLNLSLLEIAKGVAHREKLSDEDFSNLLQQISGMSCRKAKRELAALHPQSVQGFHDRIRPIDEEFSEVRFVASQELLDQLEEIKGLLAHSRPGIGLGQLIEVLASEYRERHHPEAKARRAQERERARETEREANPEKQERGEQQKQPSPTATRVVRSEDDRRHPSAQLLRALIQRDGYQCAHVDQETRKRCESRYGPEADHYPVPWSRACYYPQVPS